MEAEVIEEKFPISDYKRVKELLGNLDSIRQIDTKYINELFVGLLGDLEKDKEEKTSLQQAMFKSCKVITLHSRIVGDSRLISTIALATQWDILVLFNLLNNECFFL